MVWTFLPAVVSIGEQMNRTELKRTPMGRTRKSRASAAERAHMDKVAQLGCMACRTLGYEDTPAELHHVRDGAGAGMKTTNYEVVGLCGAHHRFGGYGVAYHAGPEAFEAKFGTERELLAEVYRLIGYKEQE